ncbi:MAG: hypothetical protein GX050_02635 [Firmicutes bacterium]|nr:hypothetical protein [Bacillota bacterium]
MEWDGINLQEGFCLLEQCYNRLEDAIKDEQADPQEIAFLVDDAERIVQLLSRLLRSSPLKEEDEFELVQKVKVKAEAIVQLLREEMEYIFESFKSLNTGRQAINAYEGPRVGMGYTEGKFVDRKK